MIMAKRSTGVAILSSLVSKRCITSSSRATANLLATSIRSPLVDNNTSNKCRFYNTNNNNNSSTLQEDHHYDERVPYRDIRLLDTERLEENKDITGIVQLYQAMLATDGNDLHQKKCSDIVLALIRIGDLKAAFTMLEEIRSRGVIPVLNVYYQMVSLTFHSTPSSENADVMHELYRMLVEDKYFPGQVMAGMMMHQFNRVGQYDRLFDIYRHLMNIGIEINAPCHNMVLSACGKYKPVQLKVALAVLENMERNGVEMNLSSYSAFSMVLGQTHRYELAMELIVDMEAQGIEPTSTVFTSAMSACMKSRKWNLVESLYESMMERDMRLKPLPHSHAMYISALQAQRSVEKSLKAIDTFEECVANGATLYPHAYRAVLEALLDVGQYEKCVELGNSLPNEIKSSAEAKRQFPNTMCVAYSKLGKLAEARSYMKSATMSLPTRIAYAEALIHAGKRSEARKVLFAYRNMLGRQDESRRIDLKLGTLMDTSFKHGFIGLCFQFKNMAKLNVPPGAKINAMANRLSPSGGRVCRPTELGSEVQQWHSALSGFDNLTDPFVKVLEHLAVLNKNLKGAKKSPSSTRTQQKGSKTQNNML